ncbi:MAG: CHAT domain-containing protein [Verrucomicrobiota bacterium]|nr:CHAT domain-containing protein [Verrucomicrobiota bacterium]
MKRNVVKRVQAKGYWACAGHLSRGGAQNLLMTLWPVDDKQTIPFMKDFYERAMADGNAPESLAKVQTEHLVKLRDVYGTIRAVKFAGPFVMSFQGAEWIHHIFSFTNGPCLPGRLAVTTDVPDSGKMKTLGVFAGVVGIAIITGFFTAGGEKIWGGIFPDEPEDKGSPNTTSVWNEPGGRNPGQRSTPKNPTIAAGV